jgi:hypothetical protein
METVLLATTDEPKVALPRFWQQLRESLSETVISDLYEELDFVVELPDKSWPYNSSRLYVQYNGQELASDGWEGDELAFIMEYFLSGCHVYTIHYRGLALMKRALEVLADSDQLLVNNDFGTLLPGREFIRKMAEHPQWNWFTDLEENAQ